MTLLLDLAYVLLLLLSSPVWVYRAIRQGKYRAGWPARLLGMVAAPADGDGRIWCHAVSVGEVNVLATLLPHLQSAFPQATIVITTTTRTGFELARKKFAAWPVSYAPLDFSWAVNEALRRIRPQWLLLVELELWPNLIRLAKRHGARVAIVNGRLSERSFRGYRWLRPLLAHLLAQIDRLAVQHDSYARRFTALGADPQRICITGSIKFDSPVFDRDHPRTRRLAQLAAIQESQVIFLAGSTQAPEEALALDAFLQLVSDFPQLRLILVPRHAERFSEVAALLAQCGWPWQQRSQLDASEGHDPTASSPPPTTGDSCGWPILLVDTIGELSAWWGLADIGFVGGSLGSRGGQNMIEPAACGTAICFGPQTQNFRDVTESLLACQAAEIVRNGSQLTEFVRRCLQDPAAAAARGQRAAALVAAQRGAAERTLAWLTSPEP